MVPPSSMRIPRVRTYSGYRSLRSPFTYMTITFFGSSSQMILLGLLLLLAVHTPVIFLSPVWPPPISLATTLGISVDVFSSAYLDVSVRRVPFIRLSFSPYDLWLFTIGVSPFGNPRIEAYLQLPVAYRSLSRPSSAPNAKAFSLCSY